MQNILVVEDDRELNEALCYALKKQDYHTSTAFSIQEAKEKYQSFTGKEKLQLVIQDVNLPDGEGFTFCQWVKAQQDIPVLFLTARDLEEDVLKGYDLGAEDYITKPFSMKVFADSQDPRLIQEIKNRGVNIYPVDKFPGSIKAGIDKIKDMEFFVTERSYNLITELRKYVWDKDKDGNYINEPVDEYNHLMDAIRYYVLGCLLGRILKPKDLTGIFTH